MNNEEIEKIVESWGEGIMSYADVKGCANELAKLQTKACIDTLDKFPEWLENNLRQELSMRDGYIKQVKEDLEQFKLSMKGQT